MSIETWIKEYFNLKHVKAWLISSTDHKKDKIVFDLKQRCSVIPGGYYFLFIYLFSIFTAGNFHLFFNYAIVQ